MPIETNRRKYFQSKRVIKSVTDYEVQADKNGERMTFEVLLRELVRIKNLKED